VKRPAIGWLSHQGFLAKCTRIETLRLELTVSIACRRYYFCGLIVNAIVCIFATASLAANHTAATDEAKNQAVEERMLVFPQKTSLGALSLIPHNGPMAGNARRFGSAVGTVKVSVPKGKWLSLELNTEAFKHPELVDSCSAVGLDCLIINFLSMDDSEGGWCDAALPHANHFKNLKCLILNRSDVSDAGMSKLKGQKDVESQFGAYRFTSYKNR
jgi:hypothetical protein